MIDVRDITLRQGDFVIDRLSLSVPRGGYTVLMGPTGCGKTTLLEAIAGLRPIRSGRVELGGVDVTGLKLADRGVGYVPQDRALFPTMTVEENLGFALVVRRWPGEERRRRIDELAEMLGLAHLLSRRPATLSGGESQRVALGRALAFGPAVLLLDEPLGALDDPTRRQMHDLLRQVRRQALVTVLHVTHSEDDARELADEVRRMG